MAWLRLDDGFAQHPKIVRLSARDRWTWLELLCYCARYRTEGLVPAGIAEVVRGATPAFLARCGELRLLDEPDDGDGYQVHDWADYNPPRADEFTDLDEAVDTFLKDHPDASANEIAKAIKGSRKAILDAVKRYRLGARTGSVPVPRGGTGTGTELVTRVPAPASRPVPSPRTTSKAAAAADTTSAAPEPPDANGAAAASTIREQLQALGLATLDFAPDDAPRIAAWVELATTEARANPAGFVIAGARSGEWPSSRVRAQAPPDQVERRERFVRGDGHRLPEDELEFQLSEMGAEEDELVELLDLAADLRRRSVTS